MDVIQKLDYLECVKMMEKTLLESDKGGGV